MYFSGEELDRVSDTIDRFFFRIDANMMEPFATLITQSKYTIIEFYWKLLDIMVQLKGYFTDKKFNAVLYGFEIWKRQLVTLANNVIESRDTSSGQITLSPAFALTTNSSVNQVKGTIDEHVKSYYEGIRDEVNHLRSQIDDYSRNLTEAVDNVNALLKQYIKDTEVNKQFIKYVNHVIV